jgi:hypothetical protein
MQLATADPAALAFWRRDQELNPFWPKRCKSAVRSSRILAVCVCVSGFISRYDTELAEYDYCSNGSSGGGGGGRMISAAAAAAATPVSSSRQ